MKNIQFVSEDKFGMTISYEIGGDQRSETKTGLITEKLAIEAIKVLGEALAKDSFLKAEPNQ